MVTVVSVSVFFFNIPQHKDIADKWMWRILVYSCCSTLEQPSDLWSLDSVFTEQINAGHALGRPLKSSHLTLPTVCSNMGGNAKSIVLMHLWQNGLSSPNTRTDQQNFNKPVSIVSASRAQV